MKDNLRTAVSLAAVAALIAVMAASGLAGGQSSQPEKPEVMAWGSSGSKQLGPEAPEEVHGVVDPVTIPGLAGAAQVSAGFRHSLALIDPDGSGGPSPGEVRAWVMPAAEPLDPETQQIAPTLCRWKG